MKKHCVAWQGGLEEVGRRVVGLLMRALHVRGLGWLTVGFRPRAFKVQDSEERLIEALRPQGFWGKRLSERTAYSAP